MWETSHNGSHLFFWTSTDLHNRNVVFTLLKQFNSVTIISYPAVMHVYAKVIFLKKGADPTVV